jgi:hypothetical protein
MRVGNGSAIEKTRAWVAAGSASPEEDGKRALQARFNQRLLYQFRPEL